MSDAFVGVDGGGTGTLALVVDAEGRELGRGAAGPTLIDPLAPARAADGVVEAVQRALGDADVSWPVRAVWAGLAGAGREASRAGVERLLRESGLADAVSVGTDLEAATADAFPEGPGLLMIAGTGSVGWGRGPAGAERRVGGWGAHLGDEGSGYAIGLAALRRVLHASDGRGQETELTGLVLEALHLPDARDLVDWGHRATKSDIAALTPLVVRAAEAEDPVAAELIEVAVRDLVGHVLGLRDELAPWPEPPSCAMSGGLLSPGGPLRAPLVQALGDAGVLPVDRRVRPERGAALLAIGLGQGS